MLDCPLLDALPYLEACFLTSSSSLHLAWAWTSVALNTISYKRSVDVYIVVLLFLFCDSLWSWTVSPYLRQSKAQGQPWTWGLPLMDCGRNMVECCQKLPDLTRLSQSSAQIRDKTGSGLAEASNCRFRRETWYMAWGRVHGHSMKSYIITGPYIWKKTCTVHKDLLSLFPCL